MVSIPCFFAENIIDTGKTGWKDQFSKAGH